MGCGHFQPFIRPGFSICHVVRHGHFIFWGVMSVTQGSKRSAQNTNNSLKETPINSGQNKKMEDKSAEKEMSNNLGSEVKLQDIQVRDKFKFIVFCHLTVISNWTFCALDRY